MFRILMILSLIPFGAQAAQTCTYDNRNGDGEFTLTVRHPVKADHTEIVLDKAGDIAVYTMLFTDAQITVAEAQPGLAFNHFPGDFMVLLHEPNGDFSLRLGQKMSPTPMMGKYMEYPVSCTN